jgi:hypothetical protein
MDLSALDTSLANEGVDLHLTHPVTGEPLLDTDGKPVTIRLLGMDSSRYRRHNRALLNRRLENPAKKPTADQIDEDNLAMFVALTVGWSGIGLDGVDLEFSEANAQKVYTRLPWVREQADAFIGDRKNFLRVSSVG